MLEHAEAHFNLEDASFIASMLAWIDVDLERPEWERRCFYNDLFADQCWDRLREKLRDHLGGRAWTRFQARIFWWTMKERLDVVFPNSKGEVGEFAMCAEIRALIESSALGRAVGAPARRAKADVCSGSKRL